MLCRRLLIAVLVSSVLAAPFAAQTQQNDPVSTAITHMRNLQYEQALAQLRARVQQQPDDLRAWNYLGSTLLFQEMFRRGLLESQVYGSGSELYDDKKKEPISASFEKELMSVLDRAQSLAEETLKQGPGNVEARYWLGVSHGTRASYRFTLEKSFLGALREGNRANEVHEELLKADAEYHDAKLITGVHEYVAGSLPWYIKWLASLTGQGGSRADGLRLIREATERGNYAREDAKVVLYVLYSREGMHDDAIRLLEPLVPAYPQNFILKQDLAGAYGSKHNWAAAARVYDELVAEKRAGAYDKLPWEKLLYRAATIYEKLNRLERALQLHEEAAGQPGGDRFVYRAELAAARLHAEMKRPDEARRRYQRVIEAVPNSEEGKQARRELRQLRG